MYTFFFFFTKKGICFMRQTIEIIKIYIKLHFEFCLKKNKKG